LLDDNLMTEPPTGADAPRVTVPVEIVPPTTILGDTITVANPANGFVAPTNSPLIVLYANWPPSGDVASALREPVL